MKPNGFTHFYHFFDFFFMSMIYQVTYGMKMMHTLLELFEWKLSDRALIVNPFDGLMKTKPFASYLYVIDLYTFCKNYRAI